MSLTADLKHAAHALGFALAGAAPAVTPAGLHRFYQWLDRGYAGQMGYLSARAAAYAHPRHVLPGVRSLLMLGMNYQPSSTTGAASAAATDAEATPRGRIAAYAQGQADYHDVIHARLKLLAQFLQQRCPTSQSRGVVDTAPLLEREFAQLAGLGWIGKHTLLIHPRQGSWLFLACLLTDIELEYDEPFATEHCGTCTACLDVCPTQAFPQPFVLDARRCLSYLTIELKSSIPIDQRVGWKEWVFGCDLCQEVCPWNRRAPDTTEALFVPRSDLAQFEISRLFELSDDDFRQLYRSTPLWRAKRRGLLRNAAIVLGNQARQEHLSALTKGLCDTEPLVRAACVWALRQYPAHVVATRLAEHRRHETDPLVIDEFA